MAALAVAGLLCKVRGGLAGPPRGAGARSALQPAETRPWLPQGAREPLARATLPWRGAGGWDGGRRELQHGRALSPPFHGAEEPGPCSEAGECGRGGRHRALGRGWSPPAGSRRCPRWRGARGVSAAAGSRWVLLSSSELPRLHPRRDLGVFFLHPVSRLTLRHGLILQRFAGICSAAVAVFNNFAVGFLVQTPTGASGALLIVPNLISKRSPFAETLLRCFQAALSAPRGACTGFG